MLDHQETMLRERLRKAAGTLPDAAAVQLSVRDVLACLKALDALEDAEEEIGDMVPAQDLADSESGWQEECERLEHENGQLKNQLAEALCAA